MPRILIFFALALFFSGCDFSQQRKELEERSAMLDQRELDLSQREKDIVLKETTFTKMKMFVDSVLALHISDTSIRLPEHLLGTWNVTMECVKTGCPGYVVGDKKSEQWTISSNDTIIVARAMENNKLVRVYSGAYNSDSTLRLYFPYDRTAIPEGEANRQMTILLRETGPRKMSGTRDLVQQSGCTVNFKLDLTRQQ